MNTTLSLTVPQIAKIRVTAVLKKANENEESGLGWYQDVSIGGKVPKKLVTILDETSFCEGESHLNILSQVKLERKTSHFINCAFVKSYLISKRTVYCL